jgi:hypothetical protein
MSDKIRTWNRVKRQAGKIHLPEQMPSLLTNEGNVKDPGKVADAFNNY